MRRRTRVEKKKSVKFFPEIKFFSAPSKDASTCSAKHGSTCSDKHDYIQHHVYHTTPEHYSKMLLHLQVAQPGFPSDRHVVALFPFSMDRALPNEHARTTSPKLYTTRVMTTFRFDLRHANFADIPRQCFMKKYWTFTQAIDVFHYELFNRVMVITLYPGTNCLASLPYSHTDDMLTNHKINST